MYDAKTLNNVNELNNIRETNDCIRCDCIGDRAYFRQIQYESMFEFKTVHIPMENVIK